MSKKQKIYIAGCGGMLGEAFYSVFSQNYELNAQILMLMMIGWVI